MNNVPKYIEGSSWRVFEKGLFNWFHSMGKYLQTRVQMDAPFPHSQKTRKKSGLTPKMSFGWIFSAFSNTWPLTPAKD